MGDYTISPPGELDLYQEATAATVTMEIYEDPDGDIRIVLPNEQELDARQRWINDIRAEGRLWIAEDDPGLQEEGQRKLISATMEQAALDRARHDLEVLRPLASVYTYLCRKPTLRDFVSARGMARRKFSDQDSEAIDDELSRRFLPIALGKQFVVPAGEWSAVFWSRLRSQLFPDQSDILDMVGWISSHLNGKLQNKSLLTMECDFFLYWRSQGILPAGTLFDLDVCTGLCLTMIADMLNNADPAVYDTEVASELLQRQQQADMRASGKI